MRETLFNWLRVEVMGAKCLDLFAGTGILGFEAISRGAESVISVERDKTSLQAIDDNAKVIGAVNLEVIHADAMNYLCHWPSRPNNIVFVDPPFSTNMHQRVCQLLEDHEWLASQALIYLEKRARNPMVVVPDNWESLHSIRMGQVECCLYRRILITGDRD